MPLGKGSDEEELNSTFTYDHLGRLFRGDVCDAESTPVRTDLLEYDRNGNILRHAKKRGVGSGIVTDTCNYTGNRLSLFRTEGRSDSYNYDYSGAMTYDGKNQVTLTRNILGLPFLMKCVGRSDVEFSYLADGTKCYMVKDNSEGPRYYGSFIYRYDEAAVARWHRPDPLADKYPDTSPYAFCANDPVNFVDPRGDSLMICNLSILLAIYAGLPDGQHIFTSLNKGIVDPSTLDSSSDDFFMQDLYEIATSPEMVELSLSRGYLEKNEPGLTIVSFKEAPVDYDDAIDLNDPSYFLPEGVIALGKHVKGNTGRSLFPIPSPSMSPNNNIHVIINSSSNNYKHQAVGLAHEFSHVILYLRGLPYRHDMGGPADVFIYNRAKMMSRRLGYDN